MSTPIRATLWIHVVGTTPSPSRSSTRTVVSHSGHTPPKPTARANKLQSPQRRSPRKALTAPAALVDRVGHQRFAVLESLAHTRQIGSRGLMTESITALLASARAIPRACRGPWSAAQQATTRTVTRTLTHGHIAGRRHSQVFVGHQLGGVDNELRVVLDRAQRSTDGRGAQRTASSGPSTRC